MGQINCGVFGVFPVEFSAHILSLYVPSPWFFIIQPLFLKTTSSFETFKMNIYLGLGYEFGLQINRGLAVRSPWIVGT